MIAAIKAAVSPTIPLTHEERAQRAERLAGLWTPTIWYFLDPTQGTRNGGRDPRAADCATHWRDVDGRLWSTADCVGFVMWTQGARRHLKTFAEYEGDINTDSMLIDATHKQSHFKPVKMPFRGCIIAIPSVFDAHGKRLSPGHVGTVVDVLPGFDPLKPNLALIRVAHCSPRNHKPFGQAIAITDARVFGSRAWRFLEFVA